MSDKSLVPMGSKSFEDLKKVNEYGAEYWSAREIQPLLGYTQWRRFEDAVKRAITSCKQSGNEPFHHFAGAGKPIEGGKGAVQTVNDYHLSRFACYLIAQNGDPRKPEIANAQKYFAIQARRQEISFVENQFARDCESSENIAFFFKLPFWFKINTPIGTYNPDWAIVFKGEKKVYFVAETKEKGQELRGSEKIKIKCGTEHFKQFSDIRFKGPISSVSELSR
ncbi:MAG: hypothetical protein HZA13_02550 [Nitrospirae bacterium]|nr:hypothetical protein [Nitrospirota bacterium]